MHRSSRIRQKAVPPRSFLVFGLVCGFASPALYANLIVNGDFEVPPVVAVWDGFDTYKGGSSFTGWNVLGNSVDIVSDNKTSWVWWNAASGHQSLDLNGNGPGAVFQDIATVPGELYNLSFALASNPVNAPPTATMEFLWQGQVVATIDFKTHYDQNDPGWTYLSYDLVAPTDQARLTFGSLVSTWTAGSAIDDVVLEAKSSSVPDEPSPWMAMALFLPLALDWFSRRSSYQLALARS